jgi:tetratricopeptide (TPR) repeat protein
LKLDSTNVAANFGFGKILHSYSENLDIPLKHYQAVINKDPKHYKALCQIGIVYLEKGDFEKAAEYLKSSLKINPKYILSLVSMGNLLFETGNSKNAAKYHQQALQYNPKEIQALIGLGNSLYDLGVLKPQNLQPLKP